MSAAEYRERFQQNGAPKYRNIKTTVDGITFDSQAEARRYYELKLMQQGGEILWFTRQPSFIVDDAGTRYRPDFMVCGLGREMWVEDVKGVETSKFKRDEKLWEKRFPGFPLVVIRY